LNTLIYQLEKNNKGRNNDCNRELFERQSDKMVLSDAVLDEENFKEQFLNYFFSESKQWEIFIKCTEAGKALIKNDFQEHFHYWMDELKYLDSPQVTEEPSH